MSKALIMGIETRNYTDKKTGELRMFRGVHVVWQDKQDRGLTGKACECISIREDADISNLEIGKVYSADYQVSGRYARVVGFMEVSK